MMRQQFLVAPSLYYLTWQATDNVVGGFCVDSRLWICLRRIRLVTQSRIGQTAKHALAPGRFAYLNLKLLRESWSMDLQPMSFMSRAISVLIK